MIGPVSWNFYYKLEIFTIFSFFIDGTAGIKYSHCLELRPGDTGVDANFGFTLPVDRVPKSGEETFRGIVAHLKAIPKTN